jgi:hypothetical protein
MGIGSIGSVSFYQQDQNYWQQQQAQSQAQSADDSLINVMGQAEVNEAKGLASIANGTALNRVKSQLTAAIQQVLQGSSGNSTSSATGSTGSTAASSTPSTASSNTSPTPAVGTGTVPLTTTTTLSSLGFLPGGTFSIDDGTNITKYTSTGDDTIANLINAINSGPAFVTASLNGSGKLTITARDNKETITVEGSGIDATALGFGINNNSFSPKAPAASTSASTAGTSATTSSTATSTASTTTTSKSSSSRTVSSIDQEIASSAASILNASGVSGTLVDMLA